MSGHSHWSTIARQKGAADVKRGATFTKVANLITIAAKLGGSGDPDSNPRLRMAIETAHSVNMPKDNIQRAIDKGLGKLPGQTLEEVTYGGFGPGRVAFIIEGLTDNKLRTSADLKNIFEKNKGTLGGLGSVAYLFSKKGELKVNGKGGNPEDEELELIDLGIEDIEAFEEPFDSTQGKNMQRYLVYTEATKVGEVGNKITQAGFTLESQELVMKPVVTEEISEPDLAKKVIEFVGKLEGLDDVQKVFDNADIAENLI